MELVQETYRAFVARQYGAAGRAWLGSLPKTLAATAAEWGMELGGELHGGVLACVREVRLASGEDAILKVAGPWGRPRDEIAALRAWNGGPTPRLLRADPDRGALVLERIRPGTEAADADAGEVASLLRLLRRPPWPGLAPLEEVARRRVQRAVEQERASAEEAEDALATIEDLARTPVDPVLLHGDFDERNILHCAVRGLAAIDPLSAAGDPAYDAASWAHANRRPGAGDRAEEIAAALDLDPARVRAWRSVVAVHG